MTNIERTLDLLIKSVMKDRKHINHVEVSSAWSEYISHHHSLSSAMTMFENLLLKISMQSCPENCIVNFGQYMENFRWSLNKKRLTNKQQ